MPTRSAIFAPFLITLLIVGPGGAALGQDDKQTGTASENILPEVQAANDKFTKAVALASDAYITKQINAKTVYIHTMGLAVKGALRSKKLEEANLINAAKEEATQEVLALESARGKGAAPEFAPGAKAGPTHPSSRLALKRHDANIAGAKKLFDRAWQTAHKKKLQQLNGALARASLKGDLKKANTINAAIELATAQQPGGLATGSEVLRLNANTGVTKSKDNKVAALKDSSLFAKKHANGVLQANPDKRPTLVRQGSLSALYFDGKDDALQLESSKPIPTGQNPIITIAAWLKVDPKSPAVKYQGIIGITGVQTKGTHITMGIGAQAFSKRGDEICLSHWHYTTDWSSKVKAPSGWFHLAYVHDGTHDIIYLNGTEVARKQVTFTLAPLPKVNIGYWDGLDDTIPYYFGGWLHELKLWDKALEAKEIAQLFKASKAKFK